MPWAFCAEPSLHKCTMGIGGEAARHAKTSLQSSPAAGIEMAHKNAFQMIIELKEFAGFSGAEQRYIRRSLEVAAIGIGAARRWARHDEEETSINLQARLYRALLPLVRASIPDDLALDAAAEAMTPLLTLSASDLANGRLGSFAAYRFLYERLLGSGIRPWLPSAFLAAAALPSLHPLLRKSLLGSITACDVTAAGCSIHEPAFTPEWIEKVPVTVS